MSVSSHFMIPMSSASAAGTAFQRGRSRNARPLSHSEWEDFDSARRRTSLLTLLAIYAAGLGLVVFLYEGEDIGVILSAFFAHAIYMASRVAWAAARAQRVRTGLGTLVVATRARLVPLSATVFTLR